MNISKRAKKKSNYSKLEIWDNVRVPVINKVKKDIKTVSVWKLIK
jgi:hypothetical protein